MVLLLFFSTLAAFAGFVAGYSLGARNATTSAAPVSLPRAPAPPERSVPVPAALKAEPPPPPAVPKPSPVIPPPPVETSPAPEPPTVNVIAAPEAALKAFLSAPDWQSRAKHVLHAERVAEKMKAYHADTTDEPTTALSLKVDASHEAPEKGARFFTYLVSTESLPAGFPVVIVETPDGWKVDWESFVEFRDDHFRRFAAGEGRDTGAFHLVVRNTHYFGEAFTGSDKLTPFRVDPPMTERNQYAFVPTGSELHKLLAASTEWGRPCTPVLQIARIAHGEGKFHLEIKAILAPNWRPQH